VLHVEGKCTSRGPRIVEVNTRMGGGRIHQIVEAVWGVDLIEAQLRSSLDLSSALAPSRRPRCAARNLRSARALCDDIVREPPVVATPAATPR
jgi:biotin carboxylase